MESAIINAYRDRYDLTPPTDWSLQPEGKTGVPARPDTNPHSTVHSEVGDSDGFRERVRQGLANGALSEEQHLGLLVDAAAYDLAFDEAEQVLQEVVGEFAEPVPLAENMQQYLDIWRQLWEQNAANSLPHITPTCRGSGGNWG